MKHIPISRPFVTAGLAAALLVTGVSGATGVLRWPEGYRNWAHVKTAIVTSAHPAAATEAGIHHIYANPEAVDGYRTGEFKDGATIVFELLEAREKDGVISEGPRRRIDIMTRDSRAHRATGGWAFSRNIGSERAAAEVPNIARACFACHATQKDRGFVFSRIRPEQ